MYSGDMELIRWLWASPCQAFQVVGLKTMEEKRYNGLWKLSWETGGKATARGTVR